MNEQVKLWKDPEYRAQQVVVGAGHPAGMTELDDDTLDVSGGFGTGTEGILTLGCCGTHCYYCAPETL